LSAVTDPGRTEKREDEKPIGSFSHENVIASRVRSSREIISFRHMASHANVFDFTAEIRALVRCSDQARASL
jgi:hypothetical protein